MDALRTLRRRHGKVAGTAYSQLKRDYAERVILCARTQRFQKIESGYFTYVFYEQDRRRDPSNVAAGGIKIVEDALRVAGLLTNDGWKHVLGFVAYWQVRREAPGVALFVNPYGLLSQDLALEDAPEGEEDGQAIR